VASLAAAGAVVGVVILGVGFTLLMSWLLSRTVLRGEASAFTLELPPYRRPGITRILYTSLVDRTLFVLWRAMLTAAPAGAVIWLLANIHVDGASLATHGERPRPARPGDRPRRRHPARLHHRHPANEIVVPTMLMVYMGTGQMIELESMASCARCSWTRTAGRC
jgi:ferrous iron transport protein B